MAPLTLHEGSSHNAAAACAGLAANITRLIENFLLLLMLLPSLGQQESTYTRGLHCCPAS